MKPGDNTKILKRKCGDVILDADIYYRVCGTEKPRPYHKFKRISSIRKQEKRVSCLFCGREKGLARLIIGAEGKDIVDHKDRNPLNNLRSNLRIVTARQSLLNRKYKSPKGSTGYFGVTSHLPKDSRHYRLYANFKTKNGKLLFFGLPDTPLNRVICALAHDKFVLQCGDEEYAPLNFPCFKNEPFRSILLKENFNEYKKKL